jgi:excisionase family DNA binding protein
MRRPTTRDRDWVGLSEASSLLGVSPATLRRWSDAGRLRVFTTPGGHRRFSRDALERLLPSDRTRRPSLGSAGLTPARIARTYRRVGRGVSAELPWVLSLTEEQRLLFRERGHLLASGLLQYLDAASPDRASPHLAEASKSAAEYGRMAASLGLSLSQTVEGFLRFRAPFLHELVVAARRRGFDTAQTTDLIELAERGMDRLLVATMTGHRLAQGRRRVSGSRSDGRPVLAPGDPPR